MIVLFFKESDKPTGTWIIKDCEVLSKALWKDKSECMPKRKYDLTQLHENYKDRTPLSINDSGFTSSTCLSSNSDSMGDGEDNVELNHEVSEGLFHEEDVEDSHSV